MQFRFLCLNRLKTGREQCQCLLLAHLVYRDLPRLGRQGIQIAGGDEPRAALAALQEGPEIPRIPHIVDHQQDIAIGDQLAEAHGRGLQAVERRLFVAQGLDEVGELAGEIARTLPQGDP